jgi:F-type H+-transporting ATPase subunit gamma
MKMVSAAKLKRAQDAITQMRPYAEKLSAIISNVSSTLGDNESDFSIQRDVKNTLIIAISGNRGLCGGFNNNIAKEVKDLNANIAGGVEVLFLGKKAFDFTNKVITNSTVNTGIFDELSFENSKTISAEVMAKYVAGDYDKVLVVYNSFKNAATQIVKTEQVLPMVASVEEEVNDSNSDYIYNPSKEEIIDELLPKSIHLQVYKGILDSVASEHGARMTAMHKATDNASEMLKELKLTYNKARQAAITNEILEICAGAEALNG